jgi:hypothetical protein
LHSITCEGTGALSSGSSHTVAFQFWIGAGGKTWANAKVVNVVNLLTCTLKIYTYASGADTTDSPVVSTTKWYEQKIDLKVDGGADGFREY